VIFAEVSIAFGRVEDLNEALSPDAFERLDLPWEAAFLAGRCFVRYKKSGGQRRAPLPDFTLARTQR
jgi:hypothetical protein